jgi:osmotically-inducible protein OsmY
MRPDAEIRHDVESELQWDPSVDDRRIGVIVKDGIVTLTGEVAHYSGRWAAEDVAKRVKGVRAIANEISVNMPLAGARTDTDIAEAAANALRWNIATSAAPVKVVVHDGWVTLSGEVTWGFQRAAGEHSVRHLQGVRGVTNDVVVAATLEPADIKRKIEEAFKRHAGLDAQGIQVTVKDSTIILNGSVRTWQEREDAARAAWAAPGVVHVDNQLRLH